MLRAAVRVKVVPLGGLAGSVDTSTVDTSALIGRLQY